LLLLVACTVQRPHDYIKNFDVISHTNQDKK